MAGMANLPVVPPVNPPAANGVGAQQPQAGPNIQQPVAVGVNAPAANVAQPPAQQGGKRRKQKAKKTRKTRKTLRKRKITRRH